MICRFHQIFCDGNPLKRWRWGPPVPPCVSAGAGGVRSGEAGACLGLAGGRPGGASWVQVQGQQVGPVVWMQQS